MELTDENGQAAPRSEARPDPGEESPTSQLRHLKEISYILEKLRSNRTRFLLAAAHRRRQQLGSFAAPQKQGIQSLLRPDFSGPRQAEDGEDLLQKNRQHHLRLEQEQQECQESWQRGAFSLDVELHSETPSLGTLPDLPPHNVAEADESRGGEAFSSEKHQAEATGASEAGYGRRISSGNDMYMSNAGAARDDGISLPDGAATHVSGLGPPAVTLPQRIGSSFLGKRESILQRAPVTLEGDDVDLYLGELLVPLLHDGLVNLCRLVELKENDKSKQRLGLAFHEHFDPLRWLGQYLMRHHPKNAAPQRAEAHVAAALTHLSGLGAKRSQEDELSGPASDSKEAKSANETACSGAVSAAGGEAHSTTVEKNVSSRNEQETMGAAGSLPPEMTAENPASARMGDQTAAAGPSTEAEQRRGPSVLSRLGTVALQSTPESLHKRRMQQHASFYGVLKDIVDEERSRRDFLLRREEVKQVFEAFCRDKSDPRYAKELAGRSRRSSCMSTLSEHWARRFSVSSRRRTSCVTDRTLSFAATTSGIPFAPRESRAASRRLSSVCAAAAEVGDAEGTRTEEQLDMIRRKASQGAHSQTDGEEQMHTAGEHGEPAGSLPAGTVTEESVSRLAAEKPGDVDASEAVTVCIEDFEDILQRLDTHWGMNGRLVAAFQDGLLIPVATEHADLIQYLLPEVEREPMIEDLDDVQADEFWEFVKYYAEVHAWIRRELFNKRKQQLHVRLRASNQQTLVDRLVQKKMVVVQMNEDNDEEDDPAGEEKYEHRRSTYL